ncbi:FAD-dependent monooxygenase [Actinophytocola sp.]|uniref:FAD-dependent monooxygenase n=1 Tax=Actinophytocola sp. TaxID=1872138 RepID=UPI003899EA8B
MDTDVIVVGAGPAGLVLATELALCGVRPVVLEAVTGRDTASKALNLHPRTAEVLDSRGLLESLLDHQIVLGNPPHSFFGMIPVPLDCAPFRTRYPYQLGVLQWRVETALENRLAELGGAVSWAHRLLAVAQDDEGVTATVATPAGERTIRARYLVGCDGGRSTVRKSTGTPFPGVDGKQVFVAADVVLSRSPAEWYAEIPDERKGLLRLMPGNSLAGLILSGGERLMFSLRGLEDGVHRLSFSCAATTDRHSEVTDTEVRAAIEAACGVDLEVKEIRWASRFTDTCRQVDDYRDGRVFLVGDAAHVVVPLGGQGMTLAIQDAFNLGWKLAARVNGTAPDGLLDTYQTERHPVAAYLIREARAQFALLGDGPELAPLREILVDLVRLPETNTHLAGAVSGLGVRYPMPDEDHPLAGTRLPDLDLRTAGGPVRAYHLMRDGRGLFLDFGGGGEVADALLDDWADRVRLVPGGTDEEIDADAVLVRPDGYVCWAGGVADLDRLAASLSRWFGP